MSATTKTFDGLAFPLITVRLGNGKARASVEGPDGIERASLTYSYDMPDGERFAVLAAQKLWDAHMSYDGEYTPESVVLIPSDPGTGKGYAFTPVPAYFFQK